MLSLGLMAASCSDENKEFMAEEETIVSENQFKSVYARNSYEIWSPGETISYFVKNKSSVRGLYSLVDECVAEVMNYANVKFEEADEEEDAQVIFEFEGNIPNIMTSDDDHALEEFYHTQIGKDDFKNGGVITFYEINDWSTEKLRHKVLHHLGHVLGLNDEIYNMNFNLLLNNNKTYSDICANHKYDMSFISHYKDYYEGKGRESVKKGYISGTFDPNSVMMCEIKAEWTKDNKAIKEASTLSVGDRKILMKLYPFTSNVSVPIFVGSGSSSDVVIGTWDSFSDKSKIRKRIGFGYKNAGVSGTYPLYKCVNITNSKDVRYALKKGNSFTNGVTESGYNNYFIAYIYDYAGYGRNPLGVYYKNGKYSGVSYSNDPYMKSTGNTEMGCFGAVLTDLK